jgi:transcriptional regulator with XRE-family HTH domain
MNNNVEETAGKFEDKVKLRREVGARISKLLTYRGVLQKELAGHLGVTDNTVSYFCNGARLPNVQQMIKIADFLKVPADYLLGLTDSLEFLENEAVSFMEGFATAAKVLKTYTDLAVAECEFKYDDFSEIEKTAFGVGRSYECLMWLKNTLDGVPFSVLCGGETE